MIKIVNLTPAHFDAVIALGNLVHGDNYLDPIAIEQIYQKGLKNNINASFVAINENQQLVGFRLTYAPGNWQPDKWCSTELWQTAVEQTCYFKCNTVAVAARGHGLGGKLLDASVAAVKQQGGCAGITHIWLQSPGNSAYRYFSKAGGKVIKKHADRWLENCIEEDYICPICGNECHCDAAEMILKFEMN